MFADFYYSPIQFVSLREDSQGIQGFPDEYVLKGTQTAQKKQIGNSVVPFVAKMLVEANAEALQQLEIAI